eukprot:gene6390-24258_t
MAFATDKMLTKFDALQVKIDAVARKQAGKALCKEILWDEPRNGGVGVPHVRTKMEHARINAVLRMWNATDCICSDIVQWDAKRATMNLYWERGARMKLNATLLEHGTHFTLSGGANKKRSNNEIMLIVANDMRRWKVSMVTRKPKACGEWQPRPEEYHPKVRRMADMACGTTKKNCIVVMGSDGGMLEVPNRTAKLTAGLAMLIVNEDEPGKLLRTGFRFRGNASSNYTEIVGMEAMAYIGWRITKHVDIAAMKMVSDSKTNVDAVLDVMA